MKLNFVDIINNHIHGIYIMTRKEENFNTFKSIAGIAFVVAVFIAFINLLSAENASIQMYDIVKLRSRFSSPQLIIGAVNEAIA